MLKREIGILLCLGIALIGVSGCSLKEVVSADLDKAKVFEAEAVSLFTEAVGIVKSAITDARPFTEAESTRLREIEARISILHDEALKFITVESATARTIRTALSVVRAILS